MQLNKQNKYTSNQMLVINMVSNFISLAVTGGISFVLSPYIVSTIGVDAYGFVMLANNFISYASLITIALNALAGRFITIAIHEGNCEKASRYYSSVFLANCAISTFLLLISVIICIFLEHIIYIPNDIIWDVKMLFALLFLNCVINTIGSVFSVATFATNKLYIASCRNIESSLIRAIMLVVLFLFFSPSVSYLGITSLLCSVYCIGFNIYYMNKLLPELRISKAFFDFSMVKELISSGVWSLVTRVGTLLTDGLDLFITNIFVNTTAMGVLSLAKTIPALITTVVGNLVTVFSPNFTILYAEGRYGELQKAVKQSFKIMGVLANVPVIVLIVCGERFYKLWQPTQNARQLHILSLLTCAGIIVNGVINCIYNIFTIVNKLKFNAMVLIISGLLSTAIVLVLLKTTSLGIYAVAGVSTVVLILKNLFIIVPYGSKCLNMKWYALYPEVVRALVFVGVSSIVGMILTKNIHGGWISLIVSGIISVIVSLAIGYGVILGKDERQKVNDMIIKKVVRKK